MRQCFFLLLSYSYAPQIHNSTININSVVQKIKGKATECGFILTEEPYTMRKKTQLRMYFPCQFRKFNLLKDLLIHFYSNIIQSVLCMFSMWFGSSHQTGEEKTGLKKGHWCRTAFHLGLIHVQSQGPDRKHHCSFINP